MNEMSHYGPPAPRTPSPREKTPPAGGGTRKSELVREAVERCMAGIAPGVSACDKMKKAGLIGFVQGASPDLSANPAHFDGFGRS